MRNSAARPEDSLPLSVELRIDAVCKSFEAAWKAAGEQGTPPRLEDYWQRVEPAERGPLLCELIKVELHYRRAQTPSREEYAGRFPEDAGLLGRLFERLPPDRGDMARSSARRGSGNDSPRTRDERTPDGPPAYAPAKGRAEPNATGPYPPGDNVAGQVLPLPPVIPGYEVVGTLGNGGMGVVYHARQVALNRSVALKMIRAD
jgi:hypothetical protein